MMAKLYLGGSGVSLLVAIWLFLKLYPLSRLSGAYVGSLLLAVSLNLLMLGVQYRKLKRKCPRD
jgi:hypothetical protein